MDEKAVEKAFLEELEALEKFRLSYTGLYPQAPLAREDPDVRRLVEALAFFSARTRLAAERSVGDSLVRLFRQHFPYVLSPLPAMAMLKAEPNARFVDVAELPRGLEVMVDPKAQKSDRPPYRFRTTAPLRVLPIELLSVELLQRRGKKHRILLRFSTAYGRNDPIGDLSLHINHLNDLLASMTVVHALKQHLERASVVFEKVVLEDTAGQPCEVSFGAHEVPPHEREGYEGPVDRFRQFLHFPQGELFVHLRGISPPRNWQQFSICLDVDEGWPAELRLTADTFVLNAVPIANIKRDMADPIECDGTRERYLVRHPDVSARFVPHSLRGVYLMSGKGMAPLEPGVLGPTDLGYEAHFEGKGEGRRAWLDLTLPGAFDKPERVAVEAYWTQPDIAGLQAEGLRVRLADRHVEGLRWGLSGSLAQPSSSELEDDRDSLLALVSLKSLRFLGLDELTFLARALGALRAPEMGRLVLGLTRVGLSTKPAGRKASGVCYVYDLELDRLDRSDLPRLDQFCTRLLPLLEAWSIEQVVEIVARVPRLAHESRYAR